MERAITRSSEGPSDQTGAKKGGVADPNATRAPYLYDLYEDECSRVNSYRSEEASELSLPSLNHKERMHTGNLTTENT